MAVPPIDPDRAKLTSRFGWRELGGKNDLHTGIDLSAPAGTPVFAVDNGVVIVSSPSGVLNRYGNVIVIRHDYAASRPIFSLYAHLQSRAVAVGQRVVMGQVIAAVGDTGGTREDPEHRIGAPHLHFELLTKWPPAGIDKDRLDPTRLWPGRSPAPQTVQPPQAATAPIASTKWGAVALLLALALALKAKRERQQA